MPTLDQKGFALAAGKNPETIKCWDCYDGDAFPCYGMAPHRYQATGDTKALTIRDSQNAWPSNFQVDPDIDFGGKSPDEYAGPITGVFYCPNDDCKNSLKQRLGHLGPEPSSTDREAAQQ